MPSSHHLQLNEIMDLILRTRPRKLLDIGTGFGKYGFLSREYLELWDKEGSYDDRKYRIDGIEAFEKYITPLHREIYDNIYIGNALEVIPRLTEKYDLILLIDVFEHFTKKEGEKLLADCLKLARNVLISVPVELSLQEDVFDNPYETHKYPWKEADFRDIRDKFFIRNVKSLICYIGNDSSRISGEIREYRRRRRIIAVLDFLRIKKILKKIISR